MHTILSFFSMDIVLWYTVAELWRFQDFLVNPLANLQTINKWMCERYFTISGPGRVWGGSEGSYINFRNTESTSINF